MHANHSGKEIQLARKQLSFCYCQDVNEASDPAAVLEISHSRRTGSDEEAEKENYVENKFQKSKKKSLIGTSCSTNKEIKNTPLRGRKNSELRNFETSKQIDLVEISIKEAPRARASTATPKHLTSDVVNIPSSSKTKTRKSDVTIALRENTMLTESILALAGFKEHENHVKQIADSTVGEIAAKETMERLALGISTSTDVSSNKTMVNSPISSRTRKSGETPMSIPKLNLLAMTASKPNLKASEKQGDALESIGKSMSGKRKSRCDVQGENPSKRPRATSENVRPYSVKNEKERKAEHGATDTADSKFSKTPTFSRFSKNSGSSNRHSVLNSSAVYATPHRTSIGSATSNQTIESAGRSLSARASLSTSSKGPHSVKTRNCTKLTVPVSPRLSTSHRGKRRAESESSHDGSLSSCRSQSGSGSRLFTPGRLTVPRSPRFSQRSASRSRREDSETLLMREVLFFVYIYLYASLLYTFEIFQAEAAIQQLKKRRKVTVSCLVGLQSQKP